MIKKVFNILVTGILFGLVFESPAYAALNTNAIYSPTAIINLVLLVCAIICLAWAMKILSLVRGGLFSKSWQMFVIGFCFLVFAQLIVLGERTGLIELPGYFMTSAYLLMAFTWLIGLYHTRKILG